MRRQRTRPNRMWENYRWLHLCSAIMDTAAESITWDDLLPLVQVQAALAVLE